MTRPTTPSREEVLERALKDLIDSAGAALETPRSEKVEPQARDARAVANDGGAAAAMYAKLYNELLFAVGNKWPGETRHQTALRYIQQAERGSNTPGQEGRTALNPAAAWPFPKGRQP